MRGIAQFPQPCENGDHLVSDMVVQILCDALALVGADMFDLLLKFALLRLHDAQCLGDEKVLLDQTQAVLAQLPQLVEHHSQAPLSRLVPHPLRLGR